MKKLFKARVLQFTNGKETEELKELIAEKHGDAVINAIQQFNQGRTRVIEVTPVPWDKMTAEQKIKVIDADWNDYERKTLVTAPEMAVSRLMRERARSSHQLTQS